ncbi:hypothetical protein J2128_000746 [Methanomicrobium sp. W14]|uniref:hypothetical protein n=1 Tax=Methanomicrobium sp. W14 TaxID=2817839 RepID=UPI001AE84500|nr:hypothetical protein [Methanomicrobium sp. W14]MBP2132825.1 hypothetical protein [Methanomicrobium sp. W14]
MRKGEEKMKKFNSKKLGIFLVVMLLEGAAIVGPASAATTVSSVNSNYWVTADGHYYNQNYATYSGSAEMKNGEDAERIILAVTLYNDDGYYMDGGSDTEISASSASVSGHYSNKMKLDNPYTESSLDSVNPSDHKYRVQYHLL